ncbi:MAG: D-alanyl-D-alanine carboxypeptidase [Proteobacteria bacterium]|nr:D-alanyl-D-alanine carboxypeptidase [Pseudomonadota bacterium]
MRAYLKKFLPFIFLSFCTEKPHTKELFQFNRIEELDVLSQVQTTKASKLSLPAGTVVSYQFTELESTQILHEKDPNSVLIPASVTKILSSYAALDILGESYKFHTKLFENPNEWIIESGGDPLLKLSSLDSILQKIKNSATKSQLNYAPYFFDNESVISKYFDPYHTYNPGVSALSIKENLLELSYKESSDTLFNHFFPSTNLIWNESPQKELLSPLSKTELSDTWQIDHEKWNDLSLKSKRKISEIIPLKNAGNSLIEAMSQSLKLGNPIESNPQNSKLAMDITSPPISESLADILYRSDNLAIELLCAKSFEGTLKNNAENLQNYLLNTLHINVNKNEIELDRCSGLSPLNKISAKLFSEFLKTTALKKFSGKDYYKYFVKKDYEGKVFYQKTGYLSYVRGIAGILEGPNNKHYIAVIIMNHPEYREILNEGPESPRYQEALDHLDKWDSETKAYRDTLLANWFSEIH